MKIELKKININTRMSEETVCFSADIYVDGINIGYASNRGQGGSTDYRANNNHASTMLMVKAEKFCASLPPIQFGEELGGGSYPNSLEYFIDDLIYAEEKRKDALKFSKQMKKDMLKGIIFGTMAGYRIITWKGHTIESLMRHPQGPAAIKKAIAKIKLELRDGQRILNTNLGDLLK